MVGVGPIDIFGYLGKARMPQIIDIHDRRLIGYSKSFLEILPRRNYNYLRLLRLYFILFRTNAVSHQYNLS